MVSTLILLSLTSEVVEGLIGSSIVAGTTWVVSRIGRGLDHARQQVAERLCTDEGVEAFGERVFKSINEDKFCYQESRLSTPPTKVNGKFVSFAVDVVCTLPSGKGDQRVMRVMVTFGMNPPATVKLRANTHRGKTAQIDAIDLERKAKDAPDALLQAVEDWLMECFPKRR
ncbi:MAG: hypothetical protein HY719_17095 [Planctomycetes bacterium]|nr:hypothetical protein [Planctomycetota bacterium]